MHLLKGIFCLFVFENNFVALIFYHIVLICIFSGWLADLGFVETERWKLQLKRTANKLHKIAGREKAIKTCIPMKCESA